MGALQCNLFRRQSRQSNRVSSMEHKRWENENNDPDCSHRNSVVSSERRAQKSRGRSSNLTDRISTMLRPRQASSSIERVVTSTLLIQRWYRRYRARLEARQKCSWRIFETLEFVNEQDHVRLSEFFQTLLERTKSESSLARITELLSGSPPVNNISLEDPWPEEDRPVTPIFPPIDSSYKGPRLTFPLTQVDIEAIIRSFQNKQILHPKYVRAILWNARNVLQQLPNVVHCSTQLPPHQVIIVGDLHGQLEDLLMIFHKNGLPTRENPYIFNGDFVDRGPNGIEVALLLLSLIAIPFAVYINRGNHEDFIVNLRYGFSRELEKKYKEYSPYLASMFSDVFQAMPLATVVDGRVFVVHGGISDAIDLDSLQQVPRALYRSVLRAPPFLGVPEKFTLQQLFYNDSENFSAWHQMVDLLWSDPVPWTDGCKPNRRRGGGCYFGHGVTERFLRRNNLEQIVRSHECKPEGFAFTHNGKVLTIFSASNYYSMGSNKGASCKLNSSGQLEIMQHQYIPKKTRLSLCQGVSRFESIALNELRQQLFANKDDLLAAFHRNDPTLTGRVSISTWVTVLDQYSLLQGVPWRTLRGHLVQPCPLDRNFVLYETTFEQLIVSAVGEQTSVTRTLYKHRDTLDCLFRFIDRDHSGKLSANEFCQCASLLFEMLGKPIEDSDLRQIWKSIDFNKDGMIDFNEFLEAFRLIEVGAVKSAYANPGTED